MLQHIREYSKGWIAKSIIGFIVFLLGMAGFNSIFSAVNNKQNVASVNGQPITLQDLSAAVDMQRRQILQRFGKDFDPALMDEKLLRELALGN